MALCFHDCTSCPAGWPEYQQPCLEAQSMGGRRFPLGCLKRVTLLLVYFYDCEHSNFLVQHWAEDRVLLLQGESFESIKPTLCSEKGNEDSSCLPSVAERVPGNAQVGSKSCGKALPGLTPLGRPHPSLASFMFQTRRQYGTQGKEFG